MADPSADKKPELHPLQFKWTLWHDNPDNSSKKKSDWGKNLRSVASFDTVEDFWALFNNLKEPSQLSSGSTYNLFKYGIQPKWEDPQNSAGGEWRVTIPPNRDVRLDEYWINTLLTVIGEGFAADESDDICGIVVNRKRSNRIAIWTRTALHEELQMKIGKRWKEAANMPNHLRMEYLTFKDMNMKNQSSSSKNRARYVIG